MYSNFKETKHMTMLNILTKRIKTVKILTKGIIMLKFAIKVKII